MAGRQHSTRSQKRALRNSSPATASVRPADKALADAKDHLANLRVSVLVPPLIARHTDSLLPFAKHFDPRVRRVVAEACEFMPMAQAKATLATLLQDDEPRVKARAEISVEARRAREEVVGEEAHEAEMEELLHSVETDYSPEVRAQIEEVVALTRANMVTAVAERMRPFLESMGRELAAVEREREKPSADMKRLGERTDAALAKMRAALDDVLVKTTAIDPTFERIEVARVVERAFKSARERLNDGAVELVSEVPPELEADLDEDEMVRVLRELVLSAVRSYPEGARRFVRVSARAIAGDQFELAVEDRGDGLAETALASPGGFDADVRAEQVHGAMLAARRAAEAAHRGNVSIRSVPGKGTVVTMSLPLEQE